MARVNLQEMVIRRSRREFRVPSTHTPLDQRDNFDVTTLTFTPEEAKAEAARCLDCHEICSLCVGVCPHMALMTYKIDPARFEVPVLAAENGSVEVRATKTYAVDQPLQIAVLTDFCNECGNCETVCPTSGRPYVDKPRLYLDRGDFLAEHDNAFMMFGDSVMQARIDGETHRMAVNGNVEHESPLFAATLDRDTLAVVSAEANDAADGATLWLESAAAMYTLLTRPQGINATPAGVCRSHLGIHDGRASRLHGIALDSSCHTTSVVAGAVVRGRRWEPQRQCPTSRRRHR